MTEVQIERMRPDQLDAACAKHPIAYIPLGALEFHGRHLPVGLDALKAHDLACHAARAHGGLVVPPLFHGQGGEHTPFQWTWMIPKQTLVEIVLSTVLGLEKSGIKLVIVVCGHYPNVDIADDLRTAHKAAGGTAHLEVLRECEAFPDDAPIQGDHASKCETSLMLAVDETTVDMTALEQNKQGVPLSDFPLPKPSLPYGWWFEKDPDHPWFGIAAAVDNHPDKATKELGEWGRDAFVAHVKGMVAAFETTGE